MTVALNRFQKAIYARLVSQLPEMPVYDYVPQNSAFPYVVIGEITAAPNRTKTGDGQLYTVTINVWDAVKAGRKGVQAVMDSIYLALHWQEEALPMDGFSVTEIAQDLVTSYQEPGSEADTDKYYRGVMRFRALVEES